MVSDFSNAPYDFLRFSSLNAPSKRWVFSYALAVAKHKLGTVRSKLSEIPSPQDSFQLDGSDLKSEAASRMETLVQELRERLEKLSKKNRIQEKAEMAKNLNTLLSYTPTKIYRF